MKVVAAILFLALALSSEGHAQGIASLVSSKSTNKDQFVGWTSNSTAVIRRVTCQTPSQGNGESTATCELALCTVDTLATSCSTLGTFDPEASPSVRKATIEKAELADKAVLTRLGPLVAGLSQPKTTARFVEDWSSKSAFLQLSVKHRFARALLRDVDEMSYGFLSDHPKAQFRGNKVTSISSSPDGSCLVVMLTLRATRNDVHLFCDMNVVSPTGTSPNDIKNDVALMQINDAWPTQTTFLGWTHDKHAVYRSLICVNDRSGGRGPACVLEICAIDAQTSTTSKLDACVELPGITEDEFPGRGGQRPKVKEANVVAAEQAILTKLGALDPGLKRKNTSAKTSGGATKLTLATAIGRKVLTRSVFEISSREIPASSQSISNVQLNQIVQTADEQCVATFGSFTYRTYYESVPYETPKVIAEVLCSP